MMQNMSFDAYALLTMAPPAQPGQQAPPVWVNMVPLVVLAVMALTVLLLVPTIVYLLTLQKALTRCSPENRAMSPGMVWLMLIPLFAVVWNFFVVLNMAKSLGAEFRKRGIAEDPSPGQTLGLIMAVTAIICGPAWLILWILYWIKIAGYSAKLAGPPALMPP
jgi:hypothetical protein